VTEFAREPNGSLIVTANAPALINRKLITAQAVRHQLPAVYASRAFPAAGGLISYGAVRTDIVQRTAGYVDRILKGEKPADLPVQAPIKYELVINVTAAKAIGLTVPDKLLALADEIIE
jgi:putative tryptophan/tyrosine transport system substrate-binding protein